MAEENKVVIPTNSNLNWRHRYDRCVDIEIKLRALILEIENHQDAELITSSKEALNRLITVKDTIAIRIAAQETQVQPEEHVQQDPNDLERIKQNMRGKARDIKEELQKQTTV